jgi:hypothetical protein
MWFVKGSSTRNMYCVVSLFLMLLLLTFLAAAAAAATALQRNALSYFNFMNDEGRSVVAALLPAGYDPTAAAEAAEAAAAAGGGGAGGGAADGR